MMTNDLAAAAAARASAVTAALEAADMPEGVRMFLPGARAVGVATTTMGSTAFDADTFAFALANVRTADVMFVLRTATGSAAVMLAVSMPTVNGGLIVAMRAVAGDVAMSTHTARRYAALVTAVADLAVTLENAG